MYIKSNTIDKFSESLVRRDEELNTIDDVVNENTTKLVATRISTIIVIISWYIYGKYAYFCLRGLIKYKNYNFLFPLAATLFAFVNNTNDIVNYIYHQSDCYPFWVIFVISASLNWAPISWLQAYRLALISKIYLSNLLFHIITSMAIILSGIYCTFYFLNLSLFDHAKSDTLGCGVTNPGTWTPYIMVSDIIDSVFSLTSISIIVFKSINHLKELNTRNEKLNDLVGQGIIELFIIALAKIILYPLIHYTSKVPGLDVFWDILSMIVIICAYKLVNFPYENLENSKKLDNSLRRVIFKFIETKIPYISSSKSNSVTISSGSICSPKNIKTSVLENNNNHNSRDIYQNPQNYNLNKISSNLPNGTSTNSLTNTYNFSSIINDFNKNSHDSFS
ncbi:hypothetical protein LY90DRAFT_674516 [Neocallimastix californiae]|uniref:G-protein coupled receptors family 1 profile domain-containing protein n=1 Tax=Neocallimastix californiae TaxID=1754190 RepID=A0A1Y2AXL1_9FUNG|nr:hypothetical protein LY90DRAFT_674516 [Neocallimastix californiae]|eukprot:ORY26635.1 hypothetical protein LY90DRAFT_674516 [Neocallimastix californiae]